MIKKKDLIMFKIRLFQYINKCLVQLSLGRFRSRYFSGPVFESPLRLVWRSGSRRHGHCPKAENFQNQQKFPSPQICLIFHACHFCLEDGVKKRTKIYHSAILCGRQFYARFCQMKPNFILPANLTTLSFYEFYLI